MQGLNFAYAATLIERAIGMPIVAMQLEDGSGYKFLYRIGEPIYGRDAWDFISFTPVLGAGYKVDGDLATQLRASKHKQDPQSSSDRAFAAASARIARIIRSGE